MSLIFKHSSMKSALQLQIDFNLHREKSSCMRSCLHFTHCKTTENILMCEMRTLNATCGSSVNVLRQICRIIIIFMFSFNLPSFNSRIPYKLNNI